MILIGPTIPLALAFVQALAFHEKYFGQFVTGQVSVWLMAVRTELEVKTDIVKLPIGDKARPLENE